MLEQIITAFIPTIEVMLVVLALLIFAIIARIGSGIYLNVFKLKFDFKWEIFFEGILKGIIFAISFFAFALVGAGLPIVLEVTKIVYVEGITALSYVVPVTILIYAIYKQLNLAIENFKKTFAITQEEVDSVVKPNIVG